MEDEVSKAKLLIKLGCQKAGKGFLSIRNFDFTVDACMRNTQAFIAINEFGFSSKVVRFQLAKYTQKN